jgi:hypothetical protein
VLLINKLTEGGMNALTNGRNAIRSDKVGSCGYWLGYHDASFNVMDLPDLMIDDLKEMEKIYNENKGA